MVHAPHYSARDTLHRLFIFFAYSAGLSGRDSGSVVFPMRNLTLLITFSVCPTLHAGRPLVFRFSVVRDICFDTGWGEVKARSVVVFSFRVHVKLLVCNTDQVVRVLRLICCWQACDCVFFHHADRRASINSTYTSHTPITQVLNLTLGSRQMKLTHEDVSIGSWCSQQDGKFTHVSWLHLSQRDHALTIL